MTNSIWIIFLGVFFIYFFNLVQPTVDLACNPGMCPRLGMETVATEPHQPGLNPIILIRGFSYVP